MKRHYLVILVLSLCSLVSAATAPGTDLTIALHALDNPDPSVREQAREELMRLKRSQLENLQRTVAQASPLSAEQATALHEIVTQVVLADAAAQAASESVKGFLGASLQECQVSDPSGAMRPAVLVCMRIAGFDSYRMLRTGDVILAVDGNAQVARDVQTFTAQIQSRLPGQSVALQILRGGRVDNVTVFLCARPVAADNLAVPELAQTQQESVEQYWRTTFEPIITKNDSQRGAAHRR